MKTGRKGNAAIPKHLIVLPVEDGIPIPPPDIRRLKVRKPQYYVGLSRLEVGQSVFVPDAVRAPVADLHKLKMRDGRLHTFRAVFEGDSLQPKGIRIWRVA